MSKLAFEGLFIYSEFDVAIIEEFRLKSFKPKTCINNLDDLVKSQNLDGKVKSSKFKACEFRVMRRTYRTPQ